MRSDAPRRTQAIGVERLRVVVAAISLGLSLACAPGANGAAQQDQPSLAQAFETPPAEARPRVWWHWVNGNVSEEGIRRDLAWMARVGIGGFTMFDAAFRSPPTPVVVRDPVIFHSPEWSSAVATTASEAARLGLDFGVHISGGWSETGGPWIQPQQAMKKLVWSEVEAEGGHVLDEPLPRPSDASGVFQDFGIAGDYAEPRLYRDVAVIAFPAPAGEVPPAVSISSGADAMDRRPAWRMVTTIGRWC